jgi:hypothetical protein
MAGGSCAITGCGKQRSCRGMSTVSLYDLWGSRGNCLALPVLPLAFLPPTVTVFSPEDEQKGDKIYLYTHLKQQPIW